MKPWFHGIKHLNSPNGSISRTNPLVAIVL
jgi:hypothetical protein